MALDRELASFVRERVKSVWMLEMLLLLRDQPDRTWTIADLVRELRASTALVSGHLESLQKSGLVVMEGEAARFAPANDVLLRLCDEVAAAYRERPVAVINLISAPQAQIQGLANAFKFKGGDR